MANRAKTTEQFKQEVYERVQNEYTVLGEYVTNKTKMLVKHNVCGHEWMVEPSSFLKGTGCPECSHAKQRKTQEQFEKEIFDLVGDEYVVLGKYKNTSTKIKMKHRGCGKEFEIVPNAFLRGNRCNFCGIKLTGLKNTKTHEEFENEIYSLVGDEYSLMGKYENCSTKILFRHNKCGNEFKMKPNGFLSGNRCPKCSIASRTLLKSKTNERFVEQLKERFQDEYFLVTKYVNRGTNIIFKHNLCGHEFEMTPTGFLKSSNCPCPKCDNRVVITTDDFKQEVFDLVGDEYSILEEYKGAHKKIKIKHNKCGNIYDGCRNMFLKGHRCPQCYSSKGEERISRYFQNKSIKYKPQKYFNGLLGVGGGYLKYDFYIPNYNLLIEYNGEQHYKPIDVFGGQEQLKIQQEHDKRKREYAENNGFLFLEIGYWDFDNIENILNKYIKEVA